MVSITPSCRKINLLRWLSAVFALCCGVALATTEGIYVKSAELALVGGEYHLEANFEVGLTPTLEDALNKGLPLHFDVEFELIYARWYTLYLWNKSVAELEQHYRLSYNALTPVPPELRSPASEFRYDERRAGPARPSTSAFRRRC